MIETAKIATTTKGVGRDRAFRSPVSSFMLRGMAQKRSPNARLTPTMTRKLDALQEEVDHAVNTGDVRPDELARLVSDVTRETAIPPGLHAEKVRQGQASPNVPQTPSGFQYA